MNSKKKTNSCVRFGHSLRSANQLPAQVVEFRKICYIASAKSKWNNRGKLNAIVGSRD